LRFARKSLRALRQRLQFVWGALGVWRALAAIAFFALGQWNDWAPSTWKGALPLPDWPWQGWVLIGLAALLLLFVEGAYRLYAKSQNGYSEPFLFTTTWTRGLRNSSIIEPWELSARLEIEVSGVVTCYARWAKMIYYLNGNSSWDWSEQKVVLPTQQISRGKILEIPFASIEPNSREMYLLDDRIGGSEHHDTLIRCEIVLSVDGEKQIEHRHFGIVDGRSRVMAIEVDEKRFANAK
jgi:hypothetical protein